MVLFPSGSRTSLQISRNFEEVLHFRISFWGGVVLMEENHGSHQVAHFIQTPKLKLSTLKPQLSSSI